MLRPPLSLSTSCGLLGWQPQGLASLVQNVSLNQSSRQFFCCCLFYVVYLIMVHSPLLDNALIWLQTSILEHIRYL